MCFILKFREIGSTYPLSIFLKAYLCAENTKSRPNKQETVCNKIKKKERK